MDVSTNEVLTAWTETGSELESGVPPDEVSAAAISETTDSMVGDSVD